MAPRVLHLAVLFLGFASFGRSAALGWDRLQTRLLDTARIATDAKGRLHFDPVLGEQQQQTMAKQLEQRLAKQPPTSSGLKVEPVSAEKSTPLGMSLVSNTSLYSAGLPILASKPTEAEKEEAEKASMISSIISGSVNLLQAIILLVFAFKYKSNVVDPIPKLEPKEVLPGQDFKAALCACWGNTHLCLHAACCTNCRAAHTWTVAGAMEYWPSIALQLCCAPCMPCIGGIWLRSKVRATLGLEADCCMDFLKWCCCMPCAVAQEAMDVDDESGVGVKCCCDLNHYYTGRYLQQGDQATNSVEGDGADPEP